jgi:hypothetical protein
MTLELELKRIADRLEMIHNHLVNLPEQDKKLDKRLEVEEETEEAPVKKKPGRPPKSATASNITEEDVRKAALKVVRKHPKYETEGNAPGKAEVKRILKSLGAETIEDLEKEQHAEAHAAFERVVGTYVEDASESDDLE